MLTEIKEKIAGRLAHVLDVEKDVVVNALEIPKNLQHGDLSFPSFALAKRLKRSPQEIAQEISDKISAEKWPEIESVSFVHGFVNFKIQWKELERELLRALQSSKFGYSNLGQGQRLVIDFSSPNVAKKMSIGHLRATVIGQAIYNLAKTQSYEVIGLNHLGDWGTQFGKLAWAIDNWSSEEALEAEPLKVLTALYVRFHEEAEKNPDLESHGAEYFKRLEDGDAQVTRIWKKIVELSLSDYSRLWDRLNVKHDLVVGESFYNNRLKPVEKMLEGKGLLVESQGAMVVELEGDKPPCLIRKADGASLYATRDIASAIYRRNELKADLNLYVVGQDQTLHFQQVFEVLRRMGFDWADSCHHISFGMYRFKDIGRMSTRKGNVIHLEDVLDKAVQLISELIEQKNPNLKDKNKVAEQVGIGAVIFNDLLNDRVKNVDFDWDRAVSFEGDSGPYVQYVGVRCKSLLKKFGKELPSAFPVPLTESFERELIVKLLNYDEILRSAFRVFKPHLVANYLLEICKLFNHFYHSCRVLDQNEALSSSRALLVKVTERVLIEGMSVLNIECPDEM